RIVLPFFAWSFLYLLWLIFYKQVPMSPLIALNYFLFSGMYYHFWFLYALIGLYMVIPILRIFVGNAKRSDMIYYAALWLIATAIIPLIKKFYLLFKID